MFTLRPYQSYALDCIKNFIQYTPCANGYCKAPGGAGKSVLIAKTAEFCYSLGYHVVCLARNEKLLTQNRAKFSAEYQEHIGIYCAGLGEKTINKPITIASIQSIYDKGIYLSQGEKKTIVLIDEVQNLHPDDDSETQYWKFIKSIGSPQIIGFTATDFRTGSGELTFGKMICEIPIEPLVKDGYLIAPINKAPCADNFNGVQIVRGEYDGAALDEIYNDPTLLAKSIEALQKYTPGRHSVVIFANSRKHARILQQAMADNDMQAVYVDGDTPKDELSDILSRFERREFKYLINVALLIEGWDCPSIDCVVILTKTVSKGKFEQILYRGTRPAAHLSKSDFLAIDMGGNFAEHGALGSPCHTPKKGEKKKPAGRICPVCETYVKILDMHCMDCGHVLPPPEQKSINHNHDPDMESSMLYRTENPIREVAISSWRARLHISAKTKKEMICVSFITSMYDKIDVYFQPHAENDWVRGKTAMLFKANGYEIMPDVNKYPIADLLTAFNSLLQCPTSVVFDYKRNEKFPDIIRYVHADAKVDDEPLDDEIPDFYTL